MSTPYYVDVRLILYPHRLHHSFPCLTNQVRGQWFCDVYHRDGFGLCFGIRGQNGKVFSFTTTLHILLLPNSHPGSLPFTRNAHKERHTSPKESVKKVSPSIALGVLYEMRYSNISLISCGLLNKGTLHLLVFLVSSSSTASLFLSLSLPASYPASRLVQATVHARTSRSLPSYQPRV